MSKHDKLRIAEIAEKVKIDFKFYGDLGYHHAKRDRGGNLYRAVRQILKLNQKQASEIIGISIRSWGYRERTKRLYNPGEILLLQVISGLTPTEFMDLLNDII